MSGVDLVDRLRAEVAELRELRLDDDADLIEEAAAEIEKLRKSALVDASHDPSPVPAQSGWGF